MNKVIAVLLAGLLLTGCARTEPDAAGAGDAGPERVEAWMNVESYKSRQAMNRQRSSQWLRQPGNEGKSLEEAEAALGLAKPDAKGAIEAALSIVEANPLDDLGFLALRFAFYELRSLESSELEHYQDVVFRHLEAHYVNDLRLDVMLLGLVRMGGEPGVKLVDQVVANSEHRQLRARGAFWSAMERLMEVDDLNSSPEERARVRAEVTRMAQLVADEYSDVEVFRGEPGGVAIQPVLYALDNVTVGAMLPEATAERVGGEQESLSQYRGNVLLLDFWATWCAPCIASLPDVERLQALLKDRDFQVITISIDENVELVEAFMADRMDLPYVNWFVGEQSDLYDDWAIQGVPTYIAVDRDGVVRGRSHSVESLYEVILEATGADDEARLELLGEDGFTPGPEVIPMTKPT